MDNNETIFRWATTAVLAIFAVVRIHYSRLTAHESVQIGREQGRDRSYYRLIGAVYILMFAYWLTPWLDFAHIRLPAGLRWLGVLVALAGVAIVWWTHRVLGRQWSGILELRDHHRLISCGPYRRIRHPMYTGFLILPIGITLSAANLLLGLLQIGATVAMYWARVDDEEAMMLDRFGDEYRAYMRRTGRLLPSLHRK
jgi:protein-S-isoprenylcysteine O-methyltransferase Ste14